MDKVSKKKITNLKIQLIIDLIDEATPLDQLHNLTNEVMALISKNKRNKNGHK